MQTLAEAVEVGEPDAFRGHGVEPWRGDDPTAVATQVAITEIVGEDDDEVRAAHRPSLARAWRSG